MAMRDTMVEALAKVMLNDESIVKRLKEIIDKEGNASIDANTLRGLDLYLRITGGFAPTENKVQVEDISIGVREPDDIDI